MKSNSEKATLNKVAELAGVSLGAASKVLNGGTCKIGVGAEARQRILDAARRLDYHTNMAASILRGGRSRLIGVFVDSYAQYRTLRLLQEIERLSSELGYRILTSFSHDNIAHMKADYLQFQHYGITDFICCAHDYPEFKKEIAELFWGAKDVVFMEKPCLPDMPYVQTSRIKAMTEMIKDAYRKGYRRFGTMHGHHSWQTERTLRDEFKQALLNNRLEIDEKLFYELSEKHDVKHRIRRIKEKMVLQDHPDFLYIDDFPHTVTLRFQLEGTGLKIVTHGGNGDPLFSNIGVQSFDPCYERIAEELLGLLFHPERRTTVPVIEAVYKR